MSQTAVLRSNPRIVVVILSETAHAVTVEALVNGADIRTVTLTRQNFERLYMSSQEAETLRDMAEARRVREKALAMVAGAFAAQESDRIEEAFRAYCRERLLFDPSTETGARKLWKHIERVGYGTLQTALVTFGLDAPSAKRKVAQLRAAEKAKFDAIYQGEACTAGYVMESVDRMAADGCFQAPHRMADARGSAPIGERHDAPKQHDTFRRYL